VERPRTAQTRSCHGIRLILFLPGQEDGVLREGPFSSIYIFLLLKLFSFVIRKLIGTRHPDFLPPGVVRVGVQFDLWAISGAGTTLPFPFPIAI